MTDASVEDARASDVVDALPAPDAPVDAVGPDAGDGGATPCSSAHAFCDDFEQGVPNTTVRWSSLQTGAATLNADDTDYQSPTHAARFDLASSDAGSAVTRLEKTLGGASAFRCSFEMKVAVAPNNSSSFADFFTVIATPPPGGDLTGWSLLLEYRTDSVGIYLQDTGTSTDGGSDIRAASLGLTTGAWHHVAFTADGVAHRLTIDIDGNPAYANATLYPSAVDATSVVLEMNAFGTSPWSMLFDDVVCDLGLPDGG